MPERIGVFVCHCGTNIAGVIDVKKVVEGVKGIPGVVHAVDYTYMCSDPGQEMILAAIKEHRLDSVVVAACSPTMHDKTFKGVAEKGGLNRYVADMANIREQCSWVHKDRPEEATRKAITMIRAMVRKVRGNDALTPKKVPVSKRALVIGGGIAGIQASLDIGDAGYEVLLVERNPCIGGHMAQLSETFPTLDCAQCIFTPKTTAAGQHPNIRLMAYSELEKLEGSIGQFKVTIRRKAAKVDWDKCTGCGLCEEKCPSKVPSEFDRNLANRKAIYTVFPQAVPKKAVIDTEHCIKFTKDKCGACAKVCPAGAIDYEQEDRLEEVEVGAVIIATGYDLIPMEILKEYGSGKVPDVIDSLQFERLLSASGPTFGKIQRPSDGKEPKSIAIIQCAGSRDPELYKSYCSKICCMYGAKHALLYKHKVHDGDAHVFYIDIRSAGKGYEEFVQNAIEKEDLMYYRGKVSNVYREGDKVVVRGSDTLSGREVEVAVDLVVLALATTPAEGSGDLFQKLKLSVDKDGWLMEAHPKLKPVETNTGGIFLAGTCQGPKDIPETVAQATAAATKVLQILVQDELEAEVLTSQVDESKCRGCGRCEEACEYGAIKVVEVEVPPAEEGAPALKRMVSQVNEAICHGCGKCSTICCNKAITMRNFKTGQIFDMIDAILEPEGSETKAA